MHIHMHTPTYIHIHTHIHKYMYLHTHIRHRQRYKTRQKTQTHKLTNVGGGRECSEYYGGSESPGYFRGGINGSDNWRI